MISFNIKCHAQEIYHVQILYHILIYHMYQLKYHEVGEMIKTLPEPPSYSSVSVTVMVPKTVKQERVLVKQCQLQENRNKTRL